MIQTAEPSLTERQKQILNFISEYSSENGYPPTLREIGQRFGIRSTNGVHDHLAALERKGALIRGDMKSRALRVKSAESRMLDVPLVGRVAAGTPILAEENIEETLKVDAEMVGSRSRGEIFALRVRGDSMIEAGIHDGDVLLVRKQDSARQGDVVVALLGDEATVKRFEPRGAQVRLVPANATMVPIEIEGPALESFKIAGVGVGLFRRLQSS